MGLTVPLLHGLPGAGGGQVARVRALTGADESLLEALAETPPAVRASELIAAAVLALGDATPVTAAMARQLTAGDRERLLLACAAATLGEEVDAVVPCPECDELIELPIPLRQLLSEPAGGARPETHEIVVRTAEGLRTVRFRLPRGVDLEAAAHLGRTDPDRAAADLLQRCVLQVTDGEGRPVPEPVAPEVAAALDQAVADLDPAAESMAEGSCPSCGAPVRALLDGFALLTSGLASGDRLLGEVDSLARAYHWSEADILALPLPRRRRYLDLVRAGGQP